MLTAGVNDAGGQFLADNGTGHKPEVVNMNLSEFLKLNLRSYDLSLTLGRPSNYIFLSVQHRRLTDIDQIEYSLSLIGQLL
jgi:hypothetical protein